jgi:hypothetical protein
MFKRIYFNTEGVTGGANAQTATTSASSSTDVNSATTTSTDNSQQSLNQTDANVDNANEARIPRSRLNEVLQQKKEIEEKYNALHKEHSSFKGKYEGFDQSYNSTPEFQEAINAVIKDFQDGKLTKKQVENKIDKITTEGQEQQYTDDDLVSFKEVKKLIQGSREEITKEHRDFTNKQYGTLFSAEVSEFLGITPEQYGSLDEFTKLEINMMNNLVNSEMMKINPKAFDYFDANTMKQGIAKAKEIYKKMGEKQLARFQQTKQEHAQPGIEQAPPPGDAKPNFASMSSEERSAWLLEQLNKGRN